METFFSNSKAPLNKEGILGLVGEIITLSKIVDTGARPKNHLIEGWSGPKRELHDFNYDKILFEVKTSTLSENMRFKISSPAQLLETDEKPLYLVHQIFSWNSNGISLNEFIGNFKQRLNSSKTSIVLFEELIHDAGYHSMHYDFYDSDELRLSLKKSDIYEVNDAFPKVRNSDTDNSITVGSYSIEVDGCIAQLLGDLEPVLKALKWK